MVLYDNEVLGYPITPPMRVAPSPVQSAILELSSTLIWQRRDDLVVLQGGE